MAGISVEEARDAALPSGTLLLGGRAGLHRSVTGTATLRARTPAFPALHGGELALVPVPLLRQMEPRPRLDRLISQLADAGVAAIVFLELTEDERTLLEQAAGAADQHALPVMAAPPHHTAEMVDVALHRHLAGRRETLLRRSQELQQEFTTLAFAGRGLPAIVERLATITGLPAAWEDRLLELRGWATPPASVAKAADLPVDLPALLRGARLPLLRWAKSVRPDASPEVAVLPLRADGPPGASPWTRLVVAFMAGGQVAGYISLVVQAGAADQEARLALAGAGLAASIEALRARAVTEAQGNATASLVRDWLAGRFDHPGELASRANQLGHTPAPPYGVLVLETQRVIPPDGLQRLAHTMSRATPLDSDAQGPGAEGKGSRPQRGEPVAGAGEPGTMGGGTGRQATTRPAGAPLPPEGPLALSAVLDERRTVLLVPAVSMPAVDAAAAAVHTLLVPLSAEGENAPPIFGGIGRPATRLEDVPRAYREAQQALAIARRLGGRHRVAYFGSLGVYRLLAAVAPTEELSSFYEDTLGPLVAHDQKSGGELLRTLDAYIACGGSPLDTAQRLHAHRNTVLYRLDRIAELLGVDVRQPEQRLLFHLALRAGEVLGELQPGALSHGGVSPSAPHSPSEPPGDGAAQSGPARRPTVHGLSLTGTETQPRRRLELRRAAV